MPQQLLHLRSDGKHDRTIEVDRDTDDLPKSAENTALVASNGMSPSSSWETSSVMKGSDDELIIDRASDPMNQDLRKEEVLGLDSERQETRVTSQLRSILDKQKERIISHQEQLNSQQVELNSQQEHIYSHLKDEINSLRETINSQQGQLNAPSENINSQQNNIKAHGIQLKTLNEQMTGVLEYTAHTRKFHHHLDTIMTAVCERLTKDREEAEYYASMRCSTDFC